MGFDDILLAQLLDPFRIGLIVVLVITAARTSATVGNWVPLALGVVFVAVLIPMTLGSGGEQQAAQIALGLVSNAIILAIVLAAKGRFRHADAAKAVDRRLQHSALALSPNPCDDNCGQVAEDHALRRPRAGRRSLGNARVEASIMGSRAGGRRTGPKCIAIVGPFASGKTTLLEAILARTGVIPRQNPVSSGNTVSDHSPEARAHAMSVEASVATIDFMGESLTFVDCPGSVEFAFEADAVLAASDIAVVVAEADAKKIPALQLIMRKLDDLGVPRILFLNKIDKTAAGVRDTLKMLQPASSAPLLLRQIPLRKDGAVIGSIDLALERAYIWREFAESEIAEIPGDEKAREIEARFSMLETLADHDDLLMEQLLEEKEPPRDEVFDDLSADLRDGSVTPGADRHGRKGQRRAQAAQGDPPRRAGCRDDPQAPRRSRRQRGRRPGDEDDPHRAWRQAVGLAHPVGHGRRRLGALDFADGHGQGVGHLPHARQGSGEAHLGQGRRYGGAGQARRRQDRPDADLGQGRHDAAGGA